MARPLQRALRRLLARAAGALLSLGVRRPRGGRLERLLVIRIDERVGNVLLTTPLFTALRSAFPRAEIDVLVAASKRAIVAGDVRIVPFERKAFFRRPWRFLGQLWALRRRAYDAAIDASHWHHFSASSALLLAWSGAPLRILHQRGPASAFGTHLVSGPDGGVEPEVATKLRLLGPLGIAPPPTPRMETALGRSEATQAEMRAWLEANRPAPGPVVGLAPGSRKLDHRAPLEVFAALGRAAKAQGAQVIVLWGPGEEQLAADLAARCQGVAAPPTDLEALAALMRCCAAVVANDTGPMHLAVACGAPTIALFVHSDHRRWGHGFPPNAVIPTDGRAEEEVLRDAQDALQRLLHRAKA